MESDVKQEYMRREVYKVVGGTDVRVDGIHILKEGDVFKMYSSPDTDPDNINDKYWVATSNPYPDVKHIGLCAIDAVAREEMLPDASS